MTPLEFDQKHLWHPLTQHKLHPEMLAISRAKGALLFDEEGNAIIDEVGSLIDDT